MTALYSVAVLRPSVAVRWWLRHLPVAAESTRFLLEVLAQARVRLLVVDGIDSRVLDEVAKDVATVALDPEIAELLVADRDQYDVLQRITIERPMLRLLWLPQYLDEFHLP